MKNFIHLITALTLSGLLLNSCANIDITKRRYRPGFHLDVTKKNNRLKPNERNHLKDELPVEHANIKALQVEDKVEEQPMAMSLNHETATASVEDHTKVVENRNRTADRIDPFMMTPFREVKREKLNGELRRAVFNKDEEEKYGWSVPAIVSTGLGAAALAMMITGIVFLASLIVGGSFLYWWLFALIGLLLGIGAMVTGIIGLRQTGAGEKRGRGFALGGMIAGIVAMAGALITAFWGLIYFLINNLGQ